MATTGTITEATASGARVEDEYDYVIARYYKEWLLYQVTEWDETWRPVRGYLIAHSPSRKTISEALAKEPVRTKDMPYQPYYIFFARPEVRVGESFEHAKARFLQLRAQVLSETHV